MNKNKTYWKSISEKNLNSEFTKANLNEFPEDLPVGEFIGGNGVEQFKTDRRDFLKFMGFSVAAATLASCETPVIKSIPYVNKPEEITPGVANWYSSSFYDGTDFANVLIKTREGRPIWLKGVKEGYSKGGLTPRISASILNLYNSARLNGPLANGTEASWSTIDSEIKDKLSKIASDGGNIKILSNTIISPSTNDVIDDFKTSFGANIEHVQYDPVSYYGIRKANEKAFKKAIIPNYHFDKAKAIVSINADFIANWLMPTKFGVDYSSTRKPENPWMSRHFQFESVLSLTGANADYRGQIKPSQEGLVVQSLLNAITKEDDIDHSLNKKLADTIQQAADYLNDYRGQSLVVAGSNNKEIQYIVNAINNELGNYGTTIDLANPLNVYQGNDQAVENLVKEVSSGKVDALLIYGSNPVYSLPNGAAFGEALLKVKLSVSFSEFADETATKCQYVCPDHNYLESWNDLIPIEGHYALQQPVIRPLYNTRQAQESLMVWSGKGTRGNGESTIYYDKIQRHSEELNLDWNWTLHDGCKQIIADTSPFDYNIFEGSVVNQLATKSVDWEFIAYQKELGDGKYAANAWLQELPDAITKVVWDNYITMAPSDCYKTFSIDTNDPKSAWDGVHLGQEEPAFMATVKVGDDTIKLPVYPLPGQTPGTIGISFGYGRGSGQENIGKAAFQCGQYGDYILENGNKVPLGANAYKLVSFDNGELLYSGVAELIANDEKYALACTQTHHTIMGRVSILKETTLDVFQNHPKEEYNKTINLHDHSEGGHKEVPATNYSLWEEFHVEDVGHRWGMSVDLSSCNGCGVCIVACHAENNVPIVGKDEVRRSRDMQWLRMDRYYSSIDDKNREHWEHNRREGDYDYDKMEVPEDNPTVMFMPMLCHHCNHAPCETVCPVAATTHSNEGLNMMAYNRCIGTRYCGNNCPYKVRRFNWYNYRDYKKFKNINPTQDEMARLVLNPDVVVRSRGVMEKCSFCIQRIQEGKLNAKKESRPVVDGDVVTACQDACPNDSIIFGDWNDVESEIREKSKSDRAYQALEEIGVKPNLWYQLKVRNVDEEIALETSDKKEEHNKKHEH